jgi:hypothetical protein
VIVNATIRACPGGAMIGHYNDTYLKGIVPVLVKQGKLKQDGNKYLPG